MNLKLIYRMKWILMMSGMLLIWGCGDDDVIERFVEPSLQTYFDRFANEAAARGVHIDFDSSNVSGYIRLITEQGVIGQCAHKDNEPNTVIIDKIYWDKSNDLQREFVVFHELGHCVLNREHLDDADNNGNCISIMTSGVGQCNIVYNITTRSNMLNELFK